jgi:5,6-dimethylbenzimidazole synthase
VQEIISLGQLALKLPAELVPVAYLCIGNVAEFPACPELETRGWERRESLARLIHFDGWEGRDEERASRLVPDLRKDAES